MKSYLVYMRVLMLSSDNGVWIFLGVIYFKLG